MKQPDSTIAPASAWNSAKSFHLLDEWISITERWCHVRAKLIELTGEHGGTMRAVVYLKGKRVVQPLISPYLGIEFSPTATDQPHRITRQWHDVAALFVEELRALGWHHWLTLPPAIADARPFSWADITVSVRYTYYLSTTAAADDRIRSPDVRRRCKKAQQDGYAVERNQDLEALRHNLKATEEKQGFEYLVTRELLEDAASRLGPERFRIYNAYGKNREPASSMVVLYRPGSPLQEWVAGTTHDHLRSGVSQLVFSEVLADIQALDSPVFDFCGANFPSIAAAKVQLGGVLTPYFLLEPPSLHFVAKSAIKAATWKKRRAIF